MGVHLSGSRFIFLKRQIFYFQRRIPKRVLSHYSRDRIVLSLRTKSLAIATRRAHEIARNLDEYWFTLGYKTAGIPVRELFADNPVKREFQLPLGELMSSYLGRRSAGRPATFEGAVRRGFGYFQSICGDKNLDQYTRQDALKFRDELLQRGLAPQSVTRVITTLRGATNFAISEHGLQIRNVFANVDVGRKETRRVRHPFSSEELLTIGRLCREANDQKRWLVALLSDSGMRLAEAVGLKRTDINLDSDIPHINLNPHSWRPLKTHSSTRLIPLVGESLWAAQQIAKSCETFAFPAYCKETACNANSASAALNKWLKSIGLGPGRVVHSFRHTFRDRLRAVECPSDIVDQLGGWTTAGIGHTYGTGYPLRVLEKWVRLAVGG